MRVRTRNALILLANAVLVGAVLIFAAGFFPHKAFLPGLATWREGSPPRTVSPFDRVIFMVVDALRNDFVYSESSNFTFTQGLIRSGAALPFTGHASAPTITMPRVKAITTGSVPSFLDVVLNFAESDTTSTLATQDTWLAQMKSKGQGHLVMYGDDTWLKLFPGFFARSDGTTSFFVSDFTEVDNNVTRHIPEEMQKDDWSVMVMHFLGLDHIGHKTGPRGPNMPAKQKEMDGVVEQIYTTMETTSHHQKSLLVVLGDHGMNDGGNHGGSSAGEVSTALMFISPSFKSSFEGTQCPLANVDDFKYYDRVEQSDIAPTLASLLGFPIPRNNLGIVIPRLLELWTPEGDRFEILYENALQLYNIAAATFPGAFESRASHESLCNGHESGDEERLVCTWLLLESTKTSYEGGKISFSEAMVTLNDFLQLVQKTLSGTASNYDLTKMCNGIALAGLGLVLASVAAFSSVSVSAVERNIFLIFSGSYAAIMFASSYVEEEQQFWYWVLGAWLITLTCQYRRHMFANATIWKGLDMVCVVALFGIARRWNQTGQKYAGFSDLMSEVFSQYPGFLWVLIIATYVAISQNLSSRAGFETTSTTAARNTPTKTIPLIACIAGFMFKVAFTAADAPELLQGLMLLNPALKLTTHFSLITLARVAFTGIAMMFTYTVYIAHRRQDQKNDQYTLALLDILSLFLVTQTRTSNIPIFLLFSLQLSILSRQDVESWTPTSLAITSITMQYASFFFLGGSNSISSVDLSNAYNGISGYNVVAVGALTYVSNWAGPIWWAVATCCLRQRRINQSKMMAPSQQALQRSWDEDSVFFALVTLFTSMATLGVMLACLVLREHLFIWTVFSPKYLYTLAWVWHLWVNAGINLIMLGSL